MAIKKVFSVLSLLFGIVFSSFAQYRLYTIGDSTVQDYNEGYAPRKGWGQMLPFFLDKTKVVVTNKAIGGTSSKSYYENHWKAVRDNLKAGDYVFIQFGINDRNSSDANRYAPGDVFKSYIKKFVDDTRAKNAIPVLVSTVRRCAWTNGRPYDSYHEHPQLMRDMATTLKTPLIDLDKFCYDLFVQQGELYATRFLTMNLEAGEYANYPRGNTDQVHYQEMGATENARFVVEAIEKSTNADLRKLAQCTLPRHKVTVTINDKTKSKAISRSAEFPEGINITLKTIPQTNAKFLRWEDGNRNKISEKSLYVLKMGGKDITYKAVYESNITETVTPELKIDNANKALVASEAKSYKWFFNNKEIAGETKSALPVANNGTYSVEMVLADGTKARLDICVTIGKDGVIRKIYLIGDSTVCDYKDSQSPMTGWGQVLKHFFNGDVQIFNHAIGGRSSRSFREQGRWKTVLNLLQPGDFVFIQFGHNDRDSRHAERYTTVADYKLRLDSFVVESRAKGAIPVLVSPMVMNAWNNTTMRNVFTENGNNYRGAMEEVAKACKCAFVDLNMMSFNYFKTFNSTYCSRFFFNNYEAGEYANYPTGNTDNTHFQQMGALTLCNFIAEGLKQVGDPYTDALVRYLKPTYDLNVKANIENPGSITHTIQMPEGAPITVKVLPSTGSVFEKWNQDGAEKSRKKLYTFSMPAKATVLTAVFKGGQEVKEIVPDVYKDGDKTVYYFTDATVDNYANDLILPMLKETDGLYVVEMDAKQTPINLTEADLVVISEVVPSTAAVMAQLQQMERPTLNMKVHGYKNANGAWKWATTGFGDNMEQKSVVVESNMVSHPIFKGIDLMAGNELPMLKAVNNKGLTFMNADKFADVEGDVKTIANIKGEEQSSIIEMPAGTIVNGKELPNTMLQVGINSSSYSNLTTDAEKLIQNCCFYLLNQEETATETVDNANGLKVVASANGMVFVIGEFAQPRNLILVNMSGVVLGMQLLEPGRTSQMFDFSNLRQGVYMIGVDGKYVKFVKE